MPFKSLLIYRFYLYPFLFLTLYLLTNLNYSLECLLVWSVFGAHTRNSSIYLVVLCSVSSVTYLCWKCTLVLTWLIYEDGLERKNSTPAYVQFPLGETQVNVGNCTQLNWAELQRNTRTSDIHPLPQVTVLWVTSGVTTGLRFEGTLLPPLQNHSPAATLLTTPPRMSGSLQDWAPYLL